MLSARAHTEAKHKKIQHKHKDDDDDGYIVCDYKQSDNKKIAAIKQSFTCVFE
jgi:hypothetical protein